MLPVEVKKKAENILAIIWDDGHESIYAIDRLRRECPCATCRTARDTQNNNPLRILSEREIIPDDLQLQEAVVVGRYALQFTWSDGHHEGIYSFEFLRDSCQCDKCAIES